MAALEYHSLGWEPQVTTFGEPRVGNKGLAEFLDARFADGAYRRVTHVNDPVPLLPFDRLGYWPHQGEVFIGKTELPPEKDDVWTCEGAMDESCSAGSGLTVWGGLESHRDYFHRLGLCLPQGGWLGGKKKGWFERETEWFRRKKEWWLGRKEKGGGGELK